MASRPSSASERKKLIEEYEQAKRSEAERLTAEQASAQHRKRTQRVVVLGVILAVALFLALSPPAWILPPPQPTPTAQEREASIRFAVYLQAQQLESFRARQGRLPSSLAEVGGSLPEIRYTVLTGSSYALQSTLDTTIRFTSSDSIHAFLGESMAYLGRSQ